MGPSGLLLSPNGLPMGPSGLLLGFSALQMGPNGLLLDSYWVLADSY